MLQPLLDHAVASYPREACGLLLGVSSAECVTVSRTVSLPNAMAAESQRDRFSINPREMLAWERRAASAGEAVVGIFHSHPDTPARPSAFDLEAAWPGYVYVIASASAGKIVETRAWRLDEEHGRFTEEPIDVAAE
jgi:proteasome lid subunit RPN8/RPN11